MPASEAVCPAGISSFFEVCNTDPAGNTITDPVRIGARGGGFGITRGVKASVTARKGAKNQINVRINGKPAPEALTTRYAVEEILKVSGESFDVLLDLRITVPIGAGFGTSAAGTLASCLALADATDIAMSLNDLGRVTHVAEVRHRTGLGTASALLNGGFVFVSEPGAPGIGLVDRLRFPKGHSIVCAHLGPILTRDVLAYLDLPTRVNGAAREVIAAIRKKPELLTFMTEARRFSEAVGFQTPNVSRLIEAMISGGAIGATQNMLGEAVHGVVADEKTARVMAKLRGAFPAATVFASPLDTSGVRLV